MPLTMLNLSNCAKFTDAGLIHLSDMPLTDLDLGSCYGVTARGLVHLRGKQIGRLGISEWPRVAADEALEHVRDFPLSSLDLSSSNVSDWGLGQLRGVALTSLNLSRCDDLTVEGIMQLRGMPLRQLTVHESKGFKRSGYDVVFGLVGDVFPHNMELNEDFDPD